MANSGGYNLTVQLNLQGPSNVNQVVNNINKQLGNIQANVNLNLPANVARQLANINKQMQQTSRAASEATSGMEKFGRAAGFAIKRFGAFTTATAGFYAITRATQQSLEKFVEFDKQITRIAQVTNTTRQSLGGLSAEITKLATSLGASSSELAAISVTLSQAGLSARETEKALKALALTTLAPTFNDLNQTVEGSIALMKQFSISTSQLEKALGSINAVAGSFAVEASDLITAVQRAGGVFAAASEGVSTGTDALNEFLAVFTSVRATTRESAETIATGLRTIFTRLQREDTIAALQAFGVQLTDLEGKFIGPYKAVEQLAKGLGRLDPRSLQFSGIVEELGGFRQVGKVIPLIQRFTTAQQALNVAQQGSGSLAKDAAIGQQSLAVQISKVKEEFDALIRSIGETSEFKQFIRLSLDLASALIQVADAIKPVLPAVAALGAIRIAGGIGSFARGVRGSFAGGARGFNSGGLVPGSGNTDTVRANLTPGEYVIRKKAVEAIGVSNLEKMNKYAEGGSVLSKGPVEATGAELSKTYGSLRSKVDPAQLYTANVNPIPVETDKIIRGMKARKAKKPSMYPWQNFELSVAKTYKMKTAGGQSFLDFPQQLAEAKFLPPGAVYARDKETGFLKGNNNETMLAKLVGSGLYSPGETVNVFYPEKHSEVLRKLQTKKEKQEKAAKRKTTKKNKATTATPIRKRNANGGPVQKFGRGGRTMEARDADFDQKFEGLVRDFETAPLGKRLSALRRATSAFQDYSIREMMFAQPQLQSVGPNITPALMLEGLRSGKIGYSTGIDPKFPKRTPVFFGEKLSRLTSAKKSGSTDRTTDARTHKNFLKLLGIPEDQIKGISTKALDKIISRSFRNTKKGVESKVAAYAGLSNFKPALIKYGKGQGTFGDVVKGFDKQIRDALANDSKLLSHYNGMLSAGTWSNYLATGGKAGHLPALKKKLYSIVGVTERNLGGPIERLGKGVSSEDTVPALLTPGEYVINARAASVIGEQKLNALNNADRIGYNTGGPVGPRLRFNNGGGRGWGGLGAYGMPARGTNPNSRRNNTDTGGIPGGAFTALFALQGVASGLTAAIGETSASAIATSKAIQGLATSVNVGILAFEAFKNIRGVGGKAAGAIGLVAGGFMALDSIIQAVANSTREFDRKMAQTKLGTSLDSASSAMERFAQNANDSAARLLAIESLSQAGEAANIVAETEMGRPSSLRQGYVERRLEEYGLDSEYGSEALDNAAARLRAQSTFGGIMELYDREAFNKQVIQEAERARIAASQQFARVRDPMMQMAELEVSRGASIDQIFAGLDAGQRRDIAMANVDVVRRLEGVEGPERENIINQEVMRQLNAGLGQAVANRTANVANQAAQQLQVALERVFDSMKQNFAAVASDIDSRFGRVAETLSASLGQTRIGYNNNAIKSVLENTKAFSDTEVVDAIKSTMPLLGNKGGRVGQLALASTRIEDKIGDIVDNVLLDPSVASGGKLSRIGGDLRNLISGLNLGSDIEVVINKQLKEAFDRAEDELGDAADPVEIRQRVKEIAESLPGLNGALDVVKEAMSTFASAQQKYSQVVQQVTEAVLKQREYLNRASEIRRESRIELKKTLGEEIGLNEIIGNVMTTVANQTGGITNVGALAQQQRSLIEERNRLTARRDVISGRADSNPEFVSLTQRLAELDIQLAQNRSGLEMLASSSQIASAALSEYSRIVQQGQAKMAFAEQIATATPQQYEQMKDNFRELENIIAGGAGPNLYSSRAAQDAMMQTYAEGGNLFQMREAGETALSQQRSGMLSLMKELKPFFGDNNKGFNEAYEKVLRSFLSSTGRMNPAFEQMFQEMRGQTDRQQRALQVYERATQIQVQANQALANMIDPMSALAQANDNLAKAIDALAARMNNVPGFANGGPVYASKGKLVNMQPRGTDTVPAMLTPGEFVVNAKSTKKHRGLLERINGGGVPSMQDGVSYANEGGIMGRAEMLYAARLRWYRENFGMGAQRLIPIQARNMIRGQVIQQLMIEEGQKRQKEQYEAWLGTQAGQEFENRRQGLQWGAFMDRSLTPEQREREKRRIQNLTPQQVVLEEKRIQKEKDRKAYFEEKKAQNFEKQRQRREREREQAAVEARERAERDARLRHVRAEADRARSETGGIDYDIRNPPSLIRPHSPTFNPMLDTDANRDLRFDADVREEELYGPDSPRGPKKGPNPYKLDPYSFFTREGTNMGLTLSGFYEGWGANYVEAMDVGYGERGIYTLEMKKEQEKAAEEYQQGAQAEIARQEREASKLEARQRAERARVERERKWAYLRATSQELRTRAANLLVIEQNRLQNIEEDQARAYSGVGGGILGIWDSAFNDSRDKDFFVKQRTEQYGKIQRIKYGMGIIEKANRFEPILKLPIDERLRILKEAENIFSYTGPAFRVDARDADTQRERLGEYEAGVGRTGTSAGVSLALAAIGAIAMPGVIGATTLGEGLGAVRLGSGALSQAGRVLGYGRNMIGSGIRGVQGFLNRIAPRGGQKFSEEFVGKYFQRASQQAAGQGARQAAGQGVRGTAGRGLSSPAGTGYEYMYPSGPFRIGYSSGGIVQPAYLSGGGGAWQFDDLREGRWAYEAINTDPLAWQAYNPSTKYSSPREHMSDNIRYGLTGLGFGSYAASMGLGLDASRKLVLGSPLAFAAGPREFVSGIGDIFGEDNPINPYKHTNAYFSRGGVVQPSYLYDGGYMAINTDPLAYQQYNPLTRYSSSRERSADRINYGYSGLGMGSFAASKGLGLDAAGRPVFESRFGYSDPRSDERDFQTIFGYNRYPSFLAGGGLAKGTDKYPAMLSRGEMVMNAEATRRNEGILRAMNKSSGGIVNNGILYAANGTDGPIGMAGSGGGFGGGGVLGGALELSQSMNAFIAGSQVLVGSFAELSNSLSLFTQMDFGVLNAGATTMQIASSIFRSAAVSLNTPLRGFGQSVQNFVTQTSNLISAIASIGNINGTITVTGRIDIPPIQVNVVGAEIVQRIVPDIESRVMNSIATSLANDNPGMNVSSLSVSGPY